MKRLSFCIAAFLMGAALAAGDGMGSVRIPITFGTNGMATVTVTNGAVRGYIEEILVDAPSSLCTGTIEVAALAELPTMAARVLAAKIAVADDFIVRPRIDGTETNGAALTSDPPGRPFLYGESIRASVASTTPTGSNATWWVIIKTNDK